MKRGNERDVAHRGHVGQVFKLGTLGSGWSLVVPSDGQVGVDGCTQYGNTLQELHGVSWAEGDMRKTIDRLISQGDLADIEDIEQ